MRFRRFDPVIKGYGDITGLTGEKGGGPLKVDIAVTDIATGMFVCCHRNPDRTLPPRKNRSGTAH